jgi:hypothetical protein
MVPADKIILFQEPGFHSGRPFFVAGRDTYQDALRDCEVMKADWREVGRTDGGRPRMRIVRSFYLTRKTSDVLLWHYDALLIREELGQRIQDEGFTGVSIRPINLYSSKKCVLRVPGYVELKILGAGQVDLERSGMELIGKEPRYSHWKAEKGLHFACELMDLPDVFFMKPKVTSYIFIRPRFAHFLIDNQCAPLQLVYIDDVPAPNNDHLSIQ